MWRMWAPIGVSHSSREKRQWDRVYTCATHHETQKRLLLTVMHRWNTCDQGSEPWRARTSLRAVHDMRWCYTRNLYHTPCTWYLPNQRSWQGGTCCNGSTYVWNGFHMHYLYFYSGFVRTPRWYVCTCSTPLPIRQAISLEPEVVERSVLARSIGLCLEWFGCQEPGGVRTSGSKSRVCNLGCCGSTCHFCTCALE
jgi:hypothetical protein